MEPQKEVRKGVQSPSSISFSKGPEHGVKHICQSWKSRVRFPEKSPSAPIVESPLKEKQLNAWTKPEVNTGTISLLQGIHKMADMPHKPMH